MKRVLYVTVGLVAAAVLGAFGYFIWPTPYEHYRSDGTEIRVHRITGDTHYLTVKGWRNEHGFVRE